MNEYRLVTIEFELLDATTTTTTSTPTGQCDGVPSTDWSCCSSTNTCSVGGGDCDNDSECASGLQCGNNNCKNDYSTAGITGTVIIAKRINTGKKNIAVYRPQAPLMNVPSVYPMQSQDSQ